MRRFWIIFFSVFLLFTLTVPPAQAHGFIVRAVPEDRAVLQRSPTRLQYWFSEGLEPDFSSINVRNQNGEVIATGGVDADNTALMRAQLPPNLPDGVYIAELKIAFASDGHVITETRVFSVGEASASGISSSSTASDVVPLEVVWRGMLLASTLVLFGAFSLYSIVLIPAWGSTDYPAGLLPPRVMRRVNWIVGVALAVAISAHLLSLMQQSMAFFSTGIGQVISQNLWSVVRAGSRFGELWNFRTLMLVIIIGLFGASLYFRESQPQAVRPCWRASMWGMALLLGTFSAGSHAAGSLLLPWVAMGMDWLHLTAVGLWAGGLAILTLVLTVALKPYEGDTRRLALLAVMRRFSRLALASAVIVIASGIYSTLNWVERPAELTGTRYGLSLLVKVALVLGLLIVGAVHYFALNPQRFEAIGARLQQLRFISTLRLESVLALVVVAAAALLTATPIPTPEYTLNQPPAPTETQMADGYMLTQTITPGGPGVNTYDLLISRDGQPVENADVSVRHVSPSREVRGAAQTADPVDAGLYVAADAVIDQPGQWWTLIDIRTPDDEITHTAFTWDISAEAGVIQSQPPQLRHWLALLLVVGVLFWVGLPAMRRLIHLLDLSPTMVTVAVGAVVLTVVVLAFGTLLWQEQERQYALAVNPPPTVVNTQLPTAESVASGEALFNQHCATWTAPDAAGSLSGLLVQLDTLRDDALFTLTQTGGRGLPACTGDLDTSQRWDLVNYIRTLAS
jgi:copper transport protein